VLMISQVNALTGGFVWVFWILAAAAMLVLLAAGRLPATQK